MKYLSKSQKSDINNLLTILQSGIFLKKQSVFLYYDKFVYRLCEKLYIEGLICSLTVVELESISFNQKKKIIQIYLKSFLGINILENIKKVSLKSGIRSMTLEEIINYRFVKSRLYFFSTPLGLLTYEECIRYKIGGVFLFSC